MQVPPSWEQMIPVITAQRVIALSDATVVAYDAQGAEAWSIDWQPLAEEDRAVGAPPVLRQVSPEVVAVIDNMPTDFFERWTGSADPYLPYPEDPAWTDPDHEPPVTRAGPEGRAVTASLATLEPTTT